MLACTPDTPDTCKRSPSQGDHEGGRSLPLRDRAILKLEADPTLTRAMVAKASGIGLAIRGRGACEFELPKGADLFAVLAAFECDAA